MLVAILQREAMVVMSESSNKPLYGLASGGKALGLSSTTRRRLREADALGGWVRKLTRPFVTQFIDDLKCEIGLVRGAITKEEAELKAKDRKTPPQNASHKSEAPMPP